MALNLLPMIELLEMNEVGKAVALMKGCPAPHLATVTRWCQFGIKSGSRRVCLLRERVGGRWYVRRANLIEFLHQLNKVTA